MHLKKEAVIYNHDVIRPLDKPINQHGATVVLKGNLSPGGAIIKRSAASEHLLVHTGRAVVFENIEDFKLRIEDPDLEVDENSILVLKNCGPKGYPGMPEVGNMPLPTKLLKKGITDLIRISDARMSGTAYGTVILHVCPETAVGGPIALVKEGDIISVDVPQRRLELQVSDTELAERKKQWRQEQLDYNRGYAKLYIDHVEPANQGADLDFLVGHSGDDVKRESH